MGPPCVLVVEDDDRIAAPLLRTLEREGYAVERFEEGTPAITRVGAGGVDLLLLDLGLPDMDGLDVCRQVRDGGFHGGIIILTARDGELDRVVGLDTGADDYLAKPFALAELLARTRALLRRSGSAPPPIAPPASSPVDSPFRVDRQARRVWIGGAELPTTSKEFDVLAMMESEPGSVVTRDRLISEVWDEHWFGSTKTLDATIGRLRQKLVDAQAPVEIVNVRGVGFRLEPRR
ncbi:response regulator transcription factor [Intrasporangium calvum]|uniref:Response regulator transcription factor n=1 Tax=Intrasporangium calvum TaxID=53358 RepID=A0ABT5GMR7_9MICO|nr:response regulator transcription factor [Intrasporangium calvum]MDC5699363.1 response regulator transcription factor [Intrasporangium calvum]